MSINFSSNFIPQDSDSISHNPKEGQDDMLVRESKTKTQSAYERFQQQKVEAREKYNQMTPAEKADKDMQRAVSLKHMNYPLSDEELRWLTTKRKK